MLALMDCNNFYVSCERTQNPELEGKPVVVLSTNDGCIIARSNEAKALGVAMGAAYFKVRRELQAHGVIACSGRLRLYREISKKVMALVAEMVPRVAVYSVDECFIDLDGLQQDEELCRSIKKRLWEELHIPVSLGIAETKTLAKVATHFAKRYPGYKGVAALRNDDQIRAALNLLPVSEVWGIGRRNLAKLTAEGIQTAWELHQLPEYRVRRLLPTAGVQTWLELNGRRATPLEFKGPRQSVRSTRTLAHETDNMAEIRGWISRHVAICCRTLRQEECVAATLEVYVATNRFKEEQPQHRQVLMRGLPAPTRDLMQLNELALAMVKQLCRPGHKYKRLGVGLTRLTPGPPPDPNLFASRRSQLSERINRVFQRLESQFGDGSLHLASERNLAFETLGEPETGEEGD